MKKFSCHLHSTNLLVIFSTSLLFFSHPAFTQLQRDLNYAEQMVLAPIALDEFYDDATIGIVWESSSNFSDLISALQNLEVHGLNPYHYHLQLLRELADEPIKRDRLATDAWFSAAAHMLYGKLDPTSVEPDWTAARREADLAAFLHNALASGTVATSLEQFSPKQRGYKLLVEEYAALNKQAQAHAVTVTSGAALRPGMRNERVIQLQSRLIQLELMEEDQLTNVMDAVTVEAVKLFQTMMDLDDDGIVGAATLVALNRTQQNKLEQLRVNLERWRWLPDDLGRRHVRANIASFNVSAWQDGVMERSHLAIVGKSYRKTPVFSDKIEYIIFNPWWEVPPSIARVDKLPLFKKDPDLVKDMGFQVLDRNGTVLDPDTINWNDIRAGSFPYRLRQSPGEQNALGQVKIMFPNAHNVYIHDTPTRGLFAQRQRAFSSGCLRTQDPLDLAAWLLSETPGWNKDKIDAAVASGQETRVNLTSSVQVHVLYFTVVNDDRGGIRFLDDIYQRDAAVLAGLRTTPH